MTQNLSKLLSIFTKQESALQIKKHLNSFAIGRESVCRHLGRKCNDN